MVYKKKIRRGKKNKFAFDFLSLFFSFLKKSYFGLFAQVGFLLPLLLLIKEEREKKKVFKDCGNDPSAGSPTETLLRLLLPLNDQVCPSSRKRTSALVK